METKRTKTTNHALAFLAGGIFAYGLVLSGMTQPAKVKGFLNFFGEWDPTLLIVLGVAVGVYMTAVLSARKLTKVGKGAKFVWLEQEKLSPRFFLGSIVFGIGWGMVGLCPGPALVSLGGLGGDTVLFFGIMMASVWFADQALKRLA